MKRELSSCWKGGMTATADSTTVSSRLCSVVNTMTSKVVHRGRPKTSNYQLIIDTIIKYKKTIITEDKKIVSKVHSIWEKISKEINGLRSPAALYTFVSCNRENIRNLLTADEIDNEAKNSKNHLNTTGTDDSSFNLSRDENDDNVFMFRIPLEDFDELLIKKVYVLRAKSGDGKKRRTTREVFKMKPGVWQDFFARQIWDETRSTCGYHFEYHFISANRDSGHIVGHCQCGSKIECYLRREQKIMEIKCETTPGKNKLPCGKRYLRQPKRKKAAEDLNHKSAYRYRIDEANELMKEGDPEPAIIPTAAVLRTAKWENKKSKQIDPDPVKALQIMQYANLKSNIHTISLEPFFVHYSTKHQHTIYRTVASMEGTVVAFDATGSIVKPVKKPDNSTSRAIFLYLVVVYNKDTGQIPVAQMLSEKHNVSTISFWLSEWSEQGGLPMPKEIVCDASRALLAAAVRTFTRYNTVNEYADACMENPVPASYIRIDVAHFIKKYANFLKGARPKVKEFYLASIGQLILSINIARAEKILYAIFTIACSETEGLDNDGIITPCESAKEFMAALLTLGSREIAAEELEIEETEESEDSAHDALEKNNCFLWAINIVNDVKKKVEGVEGTRVNAHFSPSLAEKLVKDCQWLPLWACTARENFGYGRIPASSSYVESEFKNLKHLFLKNETTPMRVDEFVPLHLENIMGITKLNDVTASSIEELGRPAEEIITDNEQLTEENDILRIELAGPADDSRTIDNEQRDNIKVIPIDNQQSTCPACANDDEPTGAHKCAVCGKAVHALNSCSIPYDASEEGHGQRRICLSCRKQKNRPRIIESKIVENWRGLATQTKKRSSRYLREKYAANQFLVSEKLAKIPQFKNGNDMHLKAVRIGNKKLDLSNTCAFDSIFQLFLTAAIDSPTFFHDVIEKNSSESTFVALVKSTEKQGITAAAYKCRAEILCKIFEKRGRSDISCYQLPCETTVASLCGKLLRCIGSFEEVLLCQNACNPRIVKLTTVTISMNALLDEACDTRIEDELGLSENRKCSQEGCEGSIIANLRIPGNFVIFEVSCESTQESPKIPVRSIPHSINLTDTSYSLVGLIEFQGPNIVKNNNISVIGHYIAISNRNGTWVKYEEKEKLCSSDYKANVQLIVYTKI